MKMNKALTVVAGAALVLAGCGNDGAENAGPEHPTEPSTPTQTHAQLPGRLLFSRFDESTHTFISTHTSNPDGSDEVEVTMPGPEGGGRWSRDGRHIAVLTVQDDGRVSTAIIAPDGTVERVFEIPDPTLNLLCTVWSWDDSRLACEGWDESKASRTGIYTVRASDGGGLTRLTRPGDDLVDFAGDWAPDGTVLLFKRAADEAAGDLMTVPADGGEPVALGTAQVEDAGRYSPDGSTILTSSAGQILLLSTDGTVVERIGSEARFDFGPVWSPDGTHIAYSGGSTGPYAEIFVVRADGTDEQRVTETPDNEIVVEWGAG